MKKPREQVCGRDFEARPGLCTFLISGVRFSTKIHHSQRLSSAGPHPSCTCTRPPLASRYLWNFGMTNIRTGKIVGQAERLLGKVSATAPSTRYSNTRYTCRVVVRVSTLVVVSQTGAPFVPNRTPFSTVVPHNLILRVLFGST